VATHIQRTEKNTLFAEVYVFVGFLFCSFFLFGLPTQIWTGLCMGNIEFNNGALIHEHVLGAEVRAVLQRPSCMYT